MMNNKRITRLTNLRMSPGCCWPAAAVTPRRRSLGQEQPSPSGRGERKDHLFLEAVKRQVAVVVYMHVLLVLVTSIGADLVDMHGLSLPLLRRHPAARLVLALLRRPP